MTKHSLSVICLSLASVLAVACGEAGNAGFEEDPNFDERDADTGFGGQDGDAGFGGTGGDGDVDVDEVPVAPEDGGYGLTVVADSGEEVSLTDVVSYPAGDTEDQVAYRVDRRFELGQLEIRAYCDGEGVENIEFRHSLGDETFECDPTGVLVVDRLVGPDIPGSGTLTITALGGEDTFVTWILEGVVKPR